MSEATLKPSRPKRETPPKALTEIPPGKCKHEHLDDPARFCRDCQRPIRLVSPQAKTRAEERLVRAALRWSAKRFVACGELELAARAVEKERKKGGKG